MNQQSEIDKLMTGYRDLFGEKHHLVCEGKKCVCHDEVEKYLRQALKTISDKSVNGCIEMIQKIPRLDALKPDSYENGFNQGLVEAITLLRQKWEGKDETSTGNPGSPHRILSSDGTSWDKLRQAFKEE